MLTNAQLDARVRALAGRDAPGVVLLVVGADGVRASSAVGVADLVMRDPIDPRMSMPWFSMTKIVTATTALLLVERGVLELDAPVLPLVPAMRSLRPANRARRITLRHLLQHTAGLANPLPVRWIHPAEVPGPDPDGLLKRLLRRHSRLATEPGTRSRYSNLGALVVGAAIAKATGDPFPVVVQREVLDPVGMRATGFTLPAGVAPVTGYLPRWSPMRPLLPRWVVSEAAGQWVGFRPFLLDGAAYGGLVGTPTDAAAFLRMHLADGAAGGTRVVAVRTARLMRRIDSPGRRFDLGLGWFVPAADRGADPPYVEHLGAGAGFFNVMRLYPAVGVGAVVMGNATRYDVDAIARLALEFGG
jgi:CubicO group peptidase (beta-lactamase class C family)